MRTFQAVIVWLGRVLWTIVSNRFFWLVIAIAIANYLFNTHTPGMMMILTGSLIIFAGINGARKNWHRWWFALICAVVGLSFLAIGFSAICEDLNPACQIRHSVSR